jgi:membrane fusion protein, multidrug efflux system
MSHTKHLSVSLPLLLSFWIFQSCGTSSGSEGYAPPPAQALPVFAVERKAATTYQEYSASIEGMRDIQIRPQVNGYLEKIYVDEGAKVRKGQLMFKINDLPYVEQLNNARASLAAAEANLANAKINVDKLTPLVANSVISEVQLRTAQTSYDAAKANVAQARAMVQQAQINLGYTAIKAPEDGYIGRIPLKTGSLVGTSTQEPLTVLSQTKMMYAYFSLSEKEFIAFEQNTRGKTVEEKLRHLPPVQLVLSDNSVFPANGKVEAVSGQFNNSTGSISFRASFPNDQALLRSGSTGIIRVPNELDTILLIPQQATFELQDRILVFVVDDSNKVASVPIQVTGKSGNYYLVSGGVKEGQRIVYSGLDRLQDGVVIQPQTITTDSLLKADPM